MKNEMNEMNLDQIPTPETDAMASMRRTTSEWVALARDLERRLTIAREGFKNLIDAVEHSDFSSGEYSVFEMDLAKKTLTLTAPKL